MRRRKAMQWIGWGTLSAIGAIALSPQRYQAQTAPQLEITWLGHTAFLFSSEEFQILVNPFRPIGCTAGYPTPDVSADLVLISSQLFDEGGGVRDLPNQPRVLFEGGLYQFRGRDIQGVSMPHDREGGRRFGTNVAWVWEQAGLRILHLGGAAAPLEFEQRVLIGKPDIVIVPVGGGQKAYSPELAKGAIETLKPKLVIPSHYRTAAADSDNCDLVGIEDFKALLDPDAIQQVNGNKITVSANSLPEQMQVKILNSQQLIVDN